MRKRRRRQGFEHFMMKEIHEQPKAIQDTLNSVIKDGAIDFSGLELTKEEILSFEQIYIVACGSAWHVGMAAQYVLEDMATNSSESGAGVGIPLQTDGIE